MACRRPSRGFTLLELLVVVGVVCVLAAFLMPGVQSAREAARRASCQNNLRQIGIALQNYDSVHGCYPQCNTSAASAVRENGQWETYHLYEGEFSIHVRLLPYLELRPVYDSINFTVGTACPELFGGGSRLTRPDLDTLVAINATSCSVQIATFLCPSDAGPFAETGTSYRANVGLGPHGGAWPEYPDSGNGLFSDVRLTRAAYVTDGLSHTASFSERLRGSDRDDDPVPERDFWAMPNPIFTADELLQGCQISARPGSSPTFTKGGRWWFWAGRERTLYTHTQEPNGRVPDCLMHMVFPFGMATARSRHFGGVNLLMGDGSTRFVKETISRSVWRALGTRNGGELVD
ncbi:MAG: DUF1559 domain-containing protein [Isosphaeraceae bacterium]